jgi:hypothetical protein
MQLIKIFILIYILFHGISAQDKNEDPFIEKGCYLVAVHDSINHSYYRKPLEMWKKDVIFSGTIESPLRNTKFYRYYSKWRSPSPIKLLSSFEDTIIFLPPYNPNSNSFPGIDSSTINFINQRLLQEPEFNRQKIIDFAFFYKTLIDFEYDSGKIIDSWKDIEYAPEDTISQEIKNLIKPLSISYNNIEYEFQFYVWVKYGRDLHEIKFKYKNKNFIISSKLLGKFGKMYAFM